jgi:hypothetical protein
MSFGLLLSKLPQVHEARSHYDAMLSLHSRKPSALAALWRRVRTLVS